MWPLTVILGVLPLLYCSVAIDELSFITSGELSVHCVLIGALAVLGGQEPVLSVGSQFMLAGQDTVLTVVARPAMQTVRYVTPNGSGTCNGTTHRRVLFCTSNGLVALDCDIVACWLLASQPSPLPPPPSLLPSPPLQPVEDASRGVFADSYRASAVVLTIALCAAACPLVVVCIVCPLPTPSSHPPQSSPRSTTTASPCAAGVSACLTSPLAPGQPSTTSCCRCVGRCGGTRGSPAAPTPA